MRNVYIIISADYEIFGNGTGDVMNCVVKPTTDILNACDRYGAKLTIFADMCEYWAFREYCKELEGDLGYAPHLSMEEQLRDAVRRGHDVQLHLHPHWIEAEYKCGTKNWILNYQWWGLSMLPHRLGSKDDMKSLRGIFLKGKSDLEHLLKEVDPRYECIVFRGGGLCIQPVANVFEVMKETGITMDSSVLKWSSNVNNINQPCHHDFRNAHSNIRPWRAHPEDVNRVGEGNDIIEFPILSVRLPNINPFLRSVKMKFAKTTSDRKAVVDKYGCMGHGYAEDMRNRAPSKAPTKITKYLRMAREMLGYKTLMWDFCAGRENMEIVFSKAIRDAERGKRDSVLVMTGHPKGFKNLDDFCSFLSFVNDFRSDKIAIQFSTYPEVANAFQKEGL